MWTFVSTSTIHSLLSIFLLVVFLYDQNGRSGMDRLNFPLYRACMDPWSEVRRSLEHSLIGSI